MAMFGNLRTYAKTRDALTLVQSAARRRIAVRNYDEARDALRLVQSAARRSIAVRTRKSSLRAVLRTQAAARRFLAFAHDFFADFVLLGFNDELDSVSNE